MGGFRGCPYVGTPDCREASVAVFPVWLTWRNALQFLGKIEWNAIAGFFDFAVIVFFYLPWRENLCCTGHYSRNR